MKLTMITYHVERSARAVPLAAGMLASNAKHMLGEDLEIAILDFFPDDATESCAEKVFGTDPDCAAFSVYVWNRGLSIALAAELKRRKPDIVLFAGGPEVTADSSPFLEGNIFDVSIPGEGESLFADALLLLLEGASLSTIAKAAAVPSTPDLSLLPSPYLDGTLDARALPGALWELSRGCPFACHFCYESRGGKGVRRYSGDRIRSELELFARSGVREVFVLDPTFNCDKKRAAELLALMRDTAPDIMYFMEIRSEFLDKKTAALFSSVPCSLQIGLQSAHDAVLANVGRSIDRNDFMKKVLLLHEADVTYGFDLIYGLPGDSLPGFLDSLDFALEMRPNHLDIFPLTVLPGTRLSETTAGFGLEYERTPPYAVISSPTWSGEDLEEAARVTDAVDVFYTGGRAVPWFDLMLTNLGMKASEFFSRFASKMPHPIGPDALPEAEIARVQKDFLASLFEERDSSEEAALSRDIVAVFSGGGEDGGDTVPHEFSYDPGILRQHLEAGVEDFEELAFFVPKAKRENDE